MKNGANQLAIIAAQRGVTVEQLVSDARAKHSSVAGAAREIGISRQGLWDYLHRNGWPVVSHPLPERKARAAIAAGER